MARAAPEVSFDDEFWTTVARLEAREQAQVVAALNRFRENPDHPGLNFEALQALGGLMSVRASKEVRIVLHKRGNLHVWLFADHHDRAYERARRGRFMVSPSTGRMGFVEASASERDVLPSASPSDQYEVTALEGPRPFDHWTDLELLETGLTSDAVARLRRVTIVDEVLELEGEGWDEVEIALAIDLLELTPETWRAQHQAPAEVAELAAEERLRGAISGFGALAGLSPILDERELERLASAPIEDWMLFLHPDQRALVDRELSGPGRVRGAAGTGKTVVILHRAAALAKRYRDDGDAGRVLVTTYINSLPPVFEALFRRLPSALPERVDFVNVDKLAFRICREDGKPPSVNPRAVDAAFASAWKSLVSPGSPIDMAGLSRSYVKDEIRQVIKGRGLGSLDEYLELRRVGRRTKFGEPLRRQVWELRDAWDAGMQQRKTVDFHDVLITARDHARRRPSPTYRAVLVDEAQDLTLVGLQFLRALVNGQEGDRPDGLFIGGDGAQRIYAGGFTLRQAGVEVRGRTTVLRQNYRNTREVFAAALAVAGADEVEDLAEEYTRGEEIAETERSGAPVELLIGSDEQDELRQVVKRISSLLEAADSVGPGDIAVCVPTNAQAKAIRSGLEEAGLAVQDLSTYDGTPNDLVKVGTHHRAKGLEFKAVFLPHLSSGSFPRPKPEGTDDAEYDDERALQMSALFVAMTRARDLLVLSCSGEPSEALDPVIGELALEAPG